MRFAKTEFGMRVSADQAIRDDPHFCPACNQSLILKRGKIMAPHFAHFPNKPCIDTWSYDDGPWVYGKKKKYREDEQEVIVAHSDQLHYADVVVGNNVILFQQSAISSKFFHEKTKYFQHDGKDVFWVISVEDDMAAGILRINPRDNNGIFWDHPLNFLKKVDLKANKKLHIVLDMGKGNLKKVEWVAPGSDFTRFIVDAGYTPDLTTAEGCEEAKLNQYSRFDAFKQKNMPWKKKASSTAGAPDKSWHICEKTGTWHLDQCKQCEHNLICEYRSPNPKSHAPSGLFFYCRYPAAANEVVAGEDGQPTVKVPSIWLK